MYSTQTEVREERNLLPAQQTLQEWLRNLSHDGLLSYQKRVEELADSVGATLGYLPDDLRPHCDDLKGAVRTIKDTIKHELGRRYLNGARSNFHRLLSDLQPKTPEGEAARVIIPFRQGEGEQQQPETVPALVWMACANLEREWSLYVDGVQVTNGTDQDSVRSHAAETMRENDRYVEVVAALELSREQLRAFVPQTQES